MEKVKPKVVFTMVEAGMGHIIPMQVIASAFGSKYGDKCEVVTTHIFSESEYRAVREMGEELNEHTKKTSSDFFYNKIETISYALSSKLTLKVLDAHFKKAIKLFVKEFGQLNPDLIVSSYYLPSHLARKANEQGVTDTLIATYSPDPYIYPAWDRKCDLFIVNNQKAFDMAIKKGFELKKTLQVPFIYKEEFASLDTNKVSTREKLGVKDKFTVLFTGGAYGTKGTERLIKTLLQTQKNINLIAVCGKNQTIYDNLLAMTSLKDDSVDYKVIGYTDRLSEYMVCSDVIIGKAGSNTVMETARLGKPLIINREASRLEEITAVYAKAQGLALRIKSPKKISNLIKEWASDKRALKDFEINAKKFCVDTGAETVADALFELLKTKHPNLS